MLFLGQPQLQLGSDMFCRARRLRLRIGRDVHILYILCICQVVRERNATSEKVGEGVGMYESSACDTVHVLEPIAENYM